jgi:hypothetical protein
MTRKEMELQVQQLLLQQQEFARLGLKLSPDKLLLLQRLLYRLGYNRGIPMSRKNTGNHPSPRRYSEQSQFRVIKHNRGDSTWYTLLSNENPIAHLGGFDHGNKYEITVAHANPDVRGTGAFQKLVDAAASRYREGLVSFKYQTSKSFAKALSKMKGYQDADRTHVVMGSGDTTVPVIDHPGRFDNYELIEGEHPKRTRMSRTTSTSFSQENVRRYARFTVQPGESLMGGQDFMHEVHDERGNRVGHVWVTPKEDGTLNINHGGMNEHVPNGTGFTAIRELVPQLKAMYPKHTRITGLRVSGSNPGRRSSVPMSRLPVKVIKYAKVDGHVPAHPLVAGFPIEQALRHLANDPKNSSNVRDLAKTALTGGGEPHGAPEALWLLHDALQEHQNADGTIGHPMASKYNWMSAADKVQLDQHTYRALNEAAEDVRRRTPGPHNIPDKPDLLQWMYTPEHQAVLANFVHDKSVGRDVKAAHKPLFDRINARVKELRPETTDNDVIESLRRHYFRGNRIYNERHKMKDRMKQDNERALLHPDELTKRIGQHDEEVATRYRRLPVKVIKYAMTNRSDFIDALRRIKSSNQKAMHEAAQHVAKTIGMEPMKVFDALHDTPQGSVPGVAQAVYGKVSPEQLHAAAAWMGLTGGLPGVAVFHPRPTGPDVLHRFRINGSGLDARAKLDRAGLKSRVIIPTKKGVDVLIPDVGGKLTGNVEQFADQHKVQLEASPGHFSTIGSADQARAREMFRNKVTQQEQGGM